MNGTEEHFALYKPYGYLSQFASNAKHEQNKKFLGELYTFPSGIMPIGRLDKDSEGLLLLTTDGKLSDAICKGSLVKEYYAQLDGEISQTAINQLERGVSISIHGKTFHTKPAKVRLLSTAPNLPERSKFIRADRHGQTSWISIILNEGKFRQVRKMTASVGFPTLRLVRVRIGNVYLNAMQPGEVRPLKNID